MSGLAELDRPEDYGVGATQMHDAAIAHGLVERPERIVTADEFNSAYQEELERQVERMKEDRTVEELEELEEDGDDSIIAQLREKRIAELRAAQAQKSASKASSDLREIDPLDFEQQVKVPSKQGYVMLLVYKPSHGDSVHLQNLLKTFAARNPQILVLQMAVSVHISNLPPQDCPVLLIYRQERVIKQFVRLEAFAGRETNAAVLEWCLAETGMIETELEEDPRIRIEADRRSAMARKQRMDERDDDTSDEEY